MPLVQANGIEIEYESFGSPDDETILLIMGLGSQLTHWPLELMEVLVRQGYQVIRYDNRDCGLSTRIERNGFSDMLAIYDAWGKGRAPRPLFLGRHGGRCHRPARLTGD